jgi:hypothetical protein
MVWRYFAVDTSEMFEEGVEIFAEVAADALPQQIIEPNKIRIVGQSISEDSEHFVHPQSAVGRIDRNLVHSSAGQDLKQSPQERFPIFQSVFID